MLSTMWLVCCEKAHIINHTCNSLGDVFKLSIIISERSMQVNSDRTFRAVALHQLYKQMTANNNAQLENISLATIKQRSKDRAFTALLIINVFGRTVYYDLEIELIQ